MTKYIVIRQHPQFAEGEVIDSTEYDDLVLDNLVPAYLAPADSTPTPEPQES